ncbi:MAG: hypothetical protein HYR71_00145 [Chloroflexi bacterium]|nr:hypothetical protein [Chloroflexota bacterium]
MPEISPLFLQALSYSTVSIVFVVLSAWWLYRSPLDTPVRASLKTSPRMAAVLAALLGLSTLQMVAGALWDASMHIRTGRVPGGADFLWPPHIMLYSGFLFAFIVALIAVLMIAGPAWQSGLRDPRQWVRQNPYVGAVALSSTYAIGSIPGDAIWHELFGIDLTAWSPPHVLIVTMVCVVVLSAVALLSQTRSTAGRPSIGDRAVLVLLGLALNAAYIVGVLEWELPGSATAPLIAARPMWFYPLVGGGLAFFTFVLAGRMVPIRWAATGTALAFYVIRLGVMAVLAATDNVVPLWPLGFILGAVLIDWIAPLRSGSARLRDLTTAAAFTAGYAVLAFPLIALRADMARFSGVDYLAAIVAVLAASLVLLPAARWASARLLGSPSGLTTVSG